MLLCYVQERDREEETEVGWRGDGGSYGVGILGVWYTTNGGFFYQVPGTNVVVLQRKLAGSGMEASEGVGEMGTAGKDIGNGGRV